MIKEILKLLKESVDGVSDPSNINVQKLNLNLMGVQEGIVRLGLEGLPPNDMEKIVRMLDSIEFSLETMYLFSNQVAGIKQILIDFADADDD